PTADESNPEAAVPTAPASVSRTANASGQRVGPFELEVDGVTFQVPDGWREVQLSDEQVGFISARLTIPVTDQELTLTFSTVGGGIESNIQRWQGQFQGAVPTIRQIRISGHDARWVDIRGQFQSQVGSAGQQSEWRMLGLALSKQPRDFYAKLTGPRERVSQIVDMFRQMVETAVVK
ncbi:MAG: hypothetical protein ABGZ17_18955, partial [Planctomycetaceae bacterium]